MDKIHNKKILIIQQKMIGDVLTSTFMCESIKKTYPSSIVHYLINEHTYPVIKGNPYIDKVLFITKEDEKNIFSLLKYARGVKKDTYDIVIDVYAKIESNIVTLFSNATIKISYHKWYTSWIYSNTIKSTFYEQNGAVESRLSLLKPILGNTLKVEKPRIYLSEKEHKKGKNFLIENGIKPNEPVYMIGVLGSGVEKTYPLEYMAKTIDIVAKNTSGKFLFNYIPSQYEEAKLVYDLCNTNTQSRILLEAYTKSLRDFLCVLQHCKALIGNEGGAVNMAKALDVPTFSIYSPQIKKEAWNTFADEKNIGVHILDYINESNLSNEDLYNKFAPNLFENELNHFLNTL